MLSRQTSARQLRSSLVSPAVWFAALTLMVAPVGGSVVAQTPPSFSPLAGHWSGYIGESEANPSSVLVSFHVDSDGTVSGDIIGDHDLSGVISGGNFDVGTGALRFTAAIRSADADSLFKLLFVGRIVRDTASGRVTSGKETGVFKLAKDLPASSAGHAVADVTPTRRPAPATKPPTRLTGDPGAAVRRSFVEVSDWIMRAADLVPADKYTYRPTATVRTFGQVVAHFIDGSHYYCGRAAGQTLVWSDVTEKGTITKAALLPLLKKAVTDCLTAYDGASAIGPLVDQVGQASLLYGNMVTYMRMLGLVPPST